MQKEGREDAALFELETIRSQFFYVSFLQFIDYYIFTCMILRLPTF